MNRICRLHKKGDLRVEVQHSDDMADTSVLVEMQRGGICGSDIHYYQDGGIGAIRVQQPIILGHELSGVVREIGSAVESIAVGDRVAINPSQPCGRCEYCIKGLQQHCLNMRFMGSAKTLPHVQGGFRDVCIVDMSQCHRVLDHVGFGEAACAEPLAVCLHAAAQTDGITGKRVLVTGAGPIGALCVAVAAQAGAREIVVTDIFDFTLGIAKAMGAHRTINVGVSVAGLQEEVDRHGPFDLAFECSGAAPAITSAIECLAPRGMLVQVGVAGNTTLPLDRLVGKEITFRGSMRFHEEFESAVAYINRGSIDVKPLITQTMPMEEAVAAIELATDRSRSVKVQLSFGSN